MAAEFPIPTDEVVRIARRAASSLAGRHYRRELDELQAEAYLAIARAAPDWDPARSSFPRYAYMKAYYGICEYIRGSSHIHRTEYARRVRLGLPACDPASLDREAPPGRRAPHGAASRLRDLLPAPPSDPSHRLELQEEVQSVLRRLRADCRRVLILYYLHGLTMFRISQLMDLTESRVSQLHKQAITELRGRETILSLAQHRRQPPATPVGEPPPRPVG